MTDETIEALRKESEAAHEKAADVARLLSQHSSQFSDGHIRVRNFDLSELRKALGVASNARLAMKRAIEAKRLATQSG